MGFDMKQFRLGLPLTVSFVCAILSTSQTFSQTETSLLKPAEPTPEMVEFFETKIRPVLIQRCFECHGNGQTKGGISFESRESFLKGGDSGEIVVPGKPEESSLIEAIRHDGALKMPPKQKIPEQELKDLTRWVELGAPWPTLPVPIPLGNLFDDVSEVPLGDALDTDQFAAAADATDLGVDRVLQGWGSIAEIAGGIKFDLSSVGSTGLTHGLVMNDAWGEKGGIRTLGMPFPANSPRTESGIGLHANALITFDLTEIRKAGQLPPVQPFVFRADRAGINDDAVQGSQASMYLLVITSRTTGTAAEKIISVSLNGKPQEFRLGDNAFELVGQVPEPLTSSNPVTSFEISIPPEAQFLTLVATGGMTPTENTISSDHAVFSGARLEFDAPTVSVAMLGRSAPPPEYVITEQQRAFWSFQPIREQPLPAVKNIEWVRKPLDAFVLAEMEQRGLTPVAAADRTTWLRRVTFDLVGLPPNPEDIQAYLNDSSLDADARVVDRLLNSVQYGERWGRHWLDIARFAEDQAHTFAARNYPNGFRYRDWVVKALNQDMPYDEFVMNQIAGDLLPDNDQRERLPALGYFALGPVYYADAGCAPKAAADELDDRIDTLARGLLGLTVACARCHDHKFDPISQRDYYALAGIFSSSSYREAPLVPQEVVQRFEEGQKRINEQQEILKKYLEESRIPLQQDLARQSAKFLLAAWKLKHPKAAETGLKRGRLAKEESLPEWMLARWEKFLDSDNKQKLPQLKAFLDLMPPTAESSLDTIPETVSQAAMTFQTEVLSALELQSTLKQQHAAAVAAAPTEEKSKLKEPGLPAPQSELFATLFHKDFGPCFIPQDKVESVLSAEQQKVYQDYKSELTQRQQQAPPKYPTAHTLTEGKAGNMHVYIRGNHQRLGPEVPRRFLSILSPEEPPVFSQGSGRLELARAIVDPANPLTARVLVNRVWHQHFGRGIVGTPSNFGILGERPSHPQLLDYLARMFVSNGWSLKKLHREIVLSATYHLGAHNDAKNLEVDADNRYLWRMNRRRLDVEAWRDALLSVSGGLDATVGGPSGDLGSPDNRRRTLYGAVSRHNLNPLLRLFDFPDPNITSEKRTQTTVPLQQLFVLNSDFLVRQAQSLALRLTSNPQEPDSDRIKRAYLLLFGRPATEVEVQLGLDFLASPPLTDEKGQTINSALTLWQQYTQALLGTNEFTYLD